MALFPQGGIQMTSRPCTVIHRLQFPSCHPAKACHQGLRPAGKSHRLVAIKCCSCCWLGEYNPQVSLRFALHHNCRLSLVAEEHPAISWSLLMMTVLGRRLPISPTTAALPLRLRWLMVRHPSAKPGREGHEQSGRLYGPLLRRVDAGIQEDAAHRLIQQCCWRCAAADRRGLSASVDQAFDRDADGVGQAARAARWPESSRALLEV